MNENFVVDFQKMNVFEALKKSISKGDLFTVKKILNSKRLPLDCVDPENGYSLLFYSILYHQHSIAEYLIEQEPNLALSVVRFLVFMYFSLGL